MCRSGSNLSPGYFAGREPNQPWLGTNGVSKGVSTRLERSEKRLISQHYWGMFDSGHGTKGFIPIEVRHVYLCRLVRQEQSSSNEFGMSVFVLPRAVERSYGKKTGTAEEPLAFRAIKLSGAPEGARQGSRLPHLLDLPIAGRGVGVRN